MRNKQLVNKFGTLIEINRDIKKANKLKKKPKTYLQGYKEGLLAGREQYRHR